MVYVVSKLLAIPAALDNRSIDCNHICLDMINLHIIVFSSVSSVVRAAGWLAGAAAPPATRAEAGRPAGRPIELGSQMALISITLRRTKKNMRTGFPFIGEHGISRDRYIILHSSGGGGWSTINLHSAFNKSVHILQ